MGLSDVPSAMSAKSCIPSKSSMVRSARLEVDRQAADVTFNECHGHADRRFARLRLWRVNAMYDRPALAVALDGKETLFIVFKIETVEDAGVVGGTDNLLVILFREFDDLLHEFGAEFWI